MSKQLPQNNTAEKGTMHHHRLDAVTAAHLHRIQTTHRREFGFWIKKDHIIRRAIRLYMEFLKRDCMNAVDELAEITRAIEGRSLQVNGNDREGRV